MAEFTYALDSADAAVAAIAKVRLELGDTQFNMGVKPDNSNFSDAELQLWLTEEDGSVPSAVLRACKTLSRMWTNVANSTSGPRKEELGQVAKGWADRAKELEAASIGDSADYVVRVTAIDHKHDPYRYRPEDEQGA